MKGINPRDLDIIYLYNSHQTLQQIADQYKITKQRIQQILYNHLGREDVVRIFHTRLSANALKKEVPERIKIYRLVVAKKRWSTYSEECLGCKTTDRPHERYGYCRICAYKYVPGVKEARYEATKRYNKAHPEKKAARDKRNKITYLKKRSIR